MTIARLVIYAILQWTLSGEGEILSRLHDAEQIDHARLLPLCEARLLCRDHLGVEWLTRESRPLSPMVHHAVQHGAGDPEVVAWEEIWYIEMNTGRCRSGGRMRRCVQGNEWRRLSSGMGAKELSVVQARRLKTCDDTVLCRSVKGKLWLTLDAERESAAPHTVKGSAKETVTYLITDQGRCRVDDDVVAARCSGEMGWRPLSFTREDLEDAGDVR